MSAVSASAERDAGLRLEEARQPEVQDLDPAVGGDEEVLGLEVAVDDAPFVGGGEAAGNLKRMIEDPGERQRSALEHRPQGLAFEQLGDQVRRLAVMPELMDGQDVGVVQRGRGTGLALEAVQPIRIARERSGEHLDGDLAAEARVASAVDLAHAACAERRHNLERAEAISCLERHQRADSVSSPRLFHNHSAAAMARTRG